MKVGLDSAARQMNEHGRSQHLANGYLAPADRLLQAFPGVHRPIRYMDDLVWFADSREAARGEGAVEPEGRRACGVVGEHMRDEPGRRGVGDGA